VGKQFPCARKATDGSKNAQSDNEKSTRHQKKDGQPDIKVKPIVQINNFKLAKTLITICSYTQPFVLFYEILPRAANECRAKF